MEPVRPGSDVRRAGARVREPLLPSRAATSWTRERSQGRLDDTGNRHSAYVRVGLGHQGFFGQPEVAYTSVLSNHYYLFYPGDPGPPSAPD
ncbi:MAG: hypothetical protein WKG07_03030 [Hymenobacter sp.]